ncbi:MAG TPA: beta-L-arabinofuranosidase domain-containing protein [Verrucomicrobiae bacterium]|nr:beta-L-arabinofuranosidase domain-containing protein [Verrucomicrobiae bacterium]
MKKILLVVSSLVLIHAHRPPAHAQGDGDQFLDGIGETALVARYLFNGSPQDLSRNSHHATLNGATNAFTDDPRFGRVLSLNGTSHVNLPGDLLDDHESLSVTGWLFLRSADPWQRFFDFGQDTTHYFFCTPVGAGPDDGFRARITSEGWESEQGPAAPRLSTNQWIHIAVTLDAAQKRLNTYVNGRRVAQSSNVNLNMAQVLSETGSENHLYIGRSQFDSDPHLDARLHDVRIYSIALTDQQVATIYSNKLSGASGSTSASISGSSTSGAKAFMAGITSVSDVTAETTVGHLPKLPFTVPAADANQTTGLMVRVIWPSPSNNVQVLQPGSYSITGIVAGTAFKPVAKVTVKRGSAAPAPARVLETFPLNRVTLERDEQQRETQFMKNRNKFMQGLAESNPDRYLYMFRDAFGQPQPDGAQALRGWDSQTTRLRGHATGHYLTAIAQACASSGYDPALQSNFVRKMNYLIDTLHDLSSRSGMPTNAGAAAVADPTAVPFGPGNTNYNSDLSTNGIRTDYWNWGKGFISAYPPDQFIMLEQGATYGTRNTQIWAPYYTLHKILAGLLDCYEVGGNEKALQIARNMGLWVHARLSQLPAATRISMWNRYIAGEYGGMNEVMARLNRLTNDARFLEGARLFDNINFFFGDSNFTHGLAFNVDTIRGKHANQHIPQITGALETYRGSNDPKYYRVAENFWDITRHSYMYSIGGVAGAKNPNNAECFTAHPDTLFANGFANGGQNETCATYNLLKLSRYLFQFDPEARYMDYYEQALYNHILASVAENNSGNTYHVPLNPGARKQFGNGNMSGYTCCNGTAIESSTKLQDSIYFRSANNDALYVNLYVPSTLTWSERSVTVRQRTDFPYEDSVRIVVNGEGAFDLRLRVPMWAAKGFHVKINGEQQSISGTPGTYLSLQRTWKSNDTVEIRMPFGFRLERLMDQPNIASVFFGPVLLAAEEPDARTTWQPVTLNGSDLSESIKGDPASLRFTIGDAKLKPFFETYDRHSVYFDVTLQ